MHAGAVVGPLETHETSEAARLFYRVVHESNGIDYSPQQLDAWAPCNPTHQKHIASKLAEQFVLSVKINGALVGFGSLEKPSPANECACLDMLFVHHAYQNRGVGTALAEALEREACSRGATRMRTFASLTARPFFEARGYRIVKSNKAIRNGVELPNWVMEKELA